MDILAAFADRGALTDPKEELVKARELQRDDPGPVPARIADAHGGGRERPLHRRRHRELDTREPTRGYPGTQNLPFPLVVIGLYARLRRAPRPDPLRLDRDRTGLRRTCQREPRVSRERHRASQRQPADAFQPAAGRRRRRPPQARSTPWTATATTVTRSRSREITVNSSGASIEIHDPARPFKGLSTQTHSEPNLSPPRARPRAQELQPDQQQPVQRSPQSQNPGRRATERASWGATSPPASSTAIRPTASSPRTSTSGPTSTATRR